MAHKDCWKYGYVDIDFDECMTCGQCIESKK